MNIIIVDDEQLIRQWFVYSIKNSSNNYNIVGEASNGQEALQLLEKVKVDVVITDIKMPVMDGLTLMSCANEKYADIDWIILTCYAEFEFARKAISQGAFEYLLKSEISDEEIIHKLKCLEIHRSKSNIKSDQIEYEREKMIRDILNDEIKEEQIKDAAEKCQLKLSTSSLITIAIECDYKLKNKVMDQWHPLTHYYDKFYWIRYDAAKYFVLAALKDDPSQLNSYNMMKELVIKLYEITGANLGISKVHHHIKDIKNMYKTANMALKQSFYDKNENKIYYYTEDNITEKNLLYLKTLKEDILEYLNKKRPEQLEEKIIHLLCEIETKRIKNVQWIYETVKEIFERIYFKYEEILKIDNTDYKSIINNVFRYKYCIDLKDYCKNIIKQLLEVIQSKNSKYSKPIQEAVKYIEDHYNENISLKIVAEEIYLNPNYLSQLFKKETNMKFNQFITHLRMEKTKELLKETNFKIYEIGIKVGYPNVSHFVRTFKKQEGISPYDYRSKI